MTLLKRILLYYSLTLLSSLALVGYWSWAEFRDQNDRVRAGDIGPEMKENGPVEEALEIVIFAGLPAVLIGLVSGVFLMRRALRPIQDLTAALEETEVSNLSDPVPLSGSNDELDRMTTVFNQMKERLGRSFTQAREFTLHASHELKTPLTILHSTLEQMLTHEVSAAARREKITSMIEEVQRLSGIVSQLAFLAKADAGQLLLNKETVALHDLVKDLAEEASILASSHSITVSLGACPSCYVLADRMRLRQLLLNLADNAVKYNYPGGTVSLSLRQTQGETVFTIVNTGPSLPPDQRPRVFDRFFRGDPAHSTRIEGSGLGLSLAKSIVLAHEGHIIYDEPDPGFIRVEVDLPTVIPHQR